MSESLPFWFTQALETESESAQVRVGDTAIHYVTWGRIGNPGVVLIHGSNAPRMVALFGTLPSRSLPGGGVGPLGQWR